MKKMQDVGELISRMEKDEGESRKIEKKGEKGSGKIENGKGKGEVKRKNRIKVKEIKGEKEKPKMWKGKHWGNGTLGNNWWVHKTLGSLDPGSWGRIEIGGWFGPK